MDAAVFCVDVGYRKPHPAPVRRALALLDVPATEAVFVGDDPRWDVAGAQAAGVRPILLGDKEPGKHAGGSGQGNGSPPDPGPVGSLVVGRPRVPHSSRENSAKPL